MAYTTVANVKLELLEVANYPFSDDTINSFIVKADSIIDGYLASKYTVPFTTIPALITSISTDLTCYFILRTVYTNDRIEKEENSWVIEFYNKAISFLKRLSSGEMSLSSAYPKQVNIVSNINDYSTTFDIDDFENWQRSIKRLEDISNDRD